MFPFLIIATITAEKNEVEARLIIAKILKSEIFIPSEERLIMRPIEPVLLGKVIDVIIFWIIVSN